MILEQYMISEGSCDTEDWLLKIQVWLHLKIYKMVIFIWNNISKYITVLLYFLSNKCSLSEKKHLSKT